MSNLKNNKTENQIALDMTKKPSLPLIVGTGAILFASVVGCDMNVINQQILLNSVPVYMQNTQTAVKSQDDDTNTNTKKKISNNNSCYLQNESGEMFYDSDIEDDNAYYGNWDIDHYDDDDDFILW